jgi:hypothetical protein
VRLAALAEAAGPDGIHVIAIPGFMAIAATGDLR